MPLKSIPMRWKKYSNKKQFSLVENQVDKNARLERLNNWGKSYLLFCWQGLAQQYPVRAEWYENCSFYVESLLENLKRNFRTSLAEKALKTKLCCFLSEKALHHIFAELSSKLTWRFFVSEIKGIQFYISHRCSEICSWTETKNKKAASMVSLGLLKKNFTDWSIFTDTN